MESFPNEELMKLLDDLPRGQHAEFVGKPPNAHFESPVNIASTESLRFDVANNRGSKIFLGTVGGRIVTGERLPDGRLTRWVEGGIPIGVGDDRHIGTIAGTRAGKGRSALLTNLALLPPETSIFSIDPKGDNCRKTIHYRAEILRQKTYLFDPFGCTGSGTEKYRASYCPVKKLTRSDRTTFVPNAKLIGDSLIVNDNPYDQHWTDTAKQIVAGLSAHVATHVNYEGKRDLVTVWQLANELTTPDPDHPHRFWLQTEMEASDAGDGMVRSAARQFYDRSGGEFTSVLSNTRKHLDWISIGCVQDTLRGPSIDFGEMKRDSVCIYQSLPAMRKDALRGWTRLLVQFALASFEEEKESVGPQTVMMLDEFHSLGKMSVLESAIAQLAGLGLKLWIVLQDLSQLKKSYEKNFETFIANLGLLQVFGCADNTTLEYLSKRLGNSVTLTRSTNSPTFDQATKQAASGESWSLASHPLMDMEEISRYFARDDKQLRQLILRPGYHPMILQRTFYDKHEIFNGRFHG